jgi:hypothetical protein
MFRCLPYVLIALLLSHPAIVPRCNKLLHRALPLWLLVFVVINSIGNLFLPSSIHELARGFSALLLALALSNHLKGNSIIQNLGFCCLGIYLIHLLFVETSQSFLVRFNPDYLDHVSTATLFAVSLAIFFVSWGTTALLVRNKYIAKVLV